MKKRSIILYWLLLLVPTFVIGAFAFKLLGHEQERINQEVRFSARDRARAIAETLQITVAAVEDGLSEALCGIKNSSVTDILLDWEKSNPLLRNVFVWKPKVGLLYPVLSSSTTLEERRFNSRYDALFSGRVPWRSAGADKADAGSSDTTISKQPSLVRDIKKLKTGRQRLVNLAKGEGRTYKDGNAESVKGSCKAGGWIPWFEENRLFILGWVQPQTDGLIYGVELELMTLLSRLVADFPATAPEDMIYALLDGGGQILHQAGNGSLKEGLRPELTVSLSPYLPHWQVAVYFVEGRLSAVSGKGFIILSGLLLGIFIIAIVLGGSLLTWQAHRNMADARQKTSFVSNVSHELKTPLTSIRMYAELLSGGRIKNPEKKKQYLQVIVDESQRLTRLVNNVLDFSRLEQDRKNYHLEELELTECLRGITELNRLRVREAGMIFEVHLPEEQVLISADRDAIEQVVLNIIDNAIKYAADGGELLIELKVKNGKCEIRFNDRGQGVPSEHRSRIFEKFHRVDDNLTAQHPGSGLGLSIARRLLRDMGGDLLYESRDGGGSCFVVLFPCQSDHES
jgi:signal transduction histidine kinase